MKIESILISTIKDSRRIDTLKVVLTTAKFKAEGSVPSGKSCGTYEVDVKPLPEALRILEDFKKDILNKDFATPSDFDDYLINSDSTLEKNRLGGNVLLSLSLTFWRLFALKEKIPLYKMIARYSGREGNHLHLPCLMFNLINGGAHVSSIEPGLHSPFQEYLVIPDTESAEVSIEECKNFIIHLKNNLLSKYKHVEQGDEGGFVLPEGDPEKGLELLTEIKGKISSVINLNLGLDVAANNFFHQDKDSYNFNNRSFNNKELTEYYTGIINKYNLFSIEDPYNENDYSGFKELRANSKESLWVIGDDMTTTNPARLYKAQKEGAINGLILKPNQIGTISETIAVALLAQKDGLKTIVSHRSGETLDDFIADLAVGIGADGFKAGAPLQPERLAKYNRLKEIEGELNR
jgi:enolase